MDENAYSPRLPQPRRVSPLASGSRRILLAFTARSTNDYVLRCPLSLPYARVGLRRGQRTRDLCRPRHMSSLGYLSQALFPPFPLLLPLPRASPRTSSCSTRRLGLPPFPVLPLWAPRPPLPWDPTCPFRARGRIPPKVLVRVFPPPALLDIPQGVDFATSCSWSRSAQGTGTIIASSRATGTAAGSSSSSRPSAPFDIP